MSESNVGDLDDSPSFERILEQRLGRRTALKAAAAGFGGAVAATAIAAESAAAAGPYAAGELTYDAVPLSGALAYPTTLASWNDSLIGFPVEGAERGYGKVILTEVDGCEVTGPLFTTDDRTLFVSIQHPGIDLFAWSSIGTAPAATIGTFVNPGSWWKPTGRTQGIPRPAAVAIRRVSGPPSPTALTQHRRPACPSFRDPPSRSVRLRSSAFHYRKMEAIDTPPC